MKTKEFTLTNYHDFMGHMSIDVQDNEFLKLFGEEPEGVVIAMGFSFGEIKGKLELKDVDLFFLVALPEYGNSISDIQNLNIDSVKVRKVTKKIPVSELGQYIKRFSCCGISKELNIREFEII